MKKMEEIMNDIFRGNLSKSVLVIMKQISINFYLKFFKFFKN